MRRQGRLATSSAEQVRVMRTILENLSMVIAMPEGTREILQPNERRNSSHPIRS